MQTRATTGPSTNWLAKTSLHPARGANRSDASRFGIAWSFHSRQAGMTTQESMQMPERVHGGAGGEGGADAREGSRAISRLSYGKSVDNPCGQAAKPKSWNHRGPKWKR
ncbi:hypothetical protein [Arthrobacter methylotrophus]|uniref:hypothetical protein n=1 Tax=Arthrobacter methylotrophus TaxID=121291 RepID=UPI0031F0796A